MALSIAQEAARPTHSSRTSVNASCQASSVRRACPTALLLSPHDFFSFHASLNEEISQRGVQLVRRTVPRKKSEDVLLHRGVHARLVPVKRYPDQAWTWRQREITETLSKVRTRNVIQLLSEILVWRSGSTTIPLVMYRSKELQGRSKPANLARTTGNRAFQHRPDRRSDRASPSVMASMERSTSSSSP